MLGKKSQKGELEWRIGKAYLVTVDSGVSGCPNL